MQLDQKALEGVKREIQRFHRNSCYPEALDVELEVAAKRILQAVQPVPVATMPSDAEINALIERLSQFEGRDWETTVCYNGLRLEAAAFLAALRDERKKWQSFPQQMAAETLLEALTRADKAEALVRELEQKLKRARVAWTDGPIEQEIDRLRFEAFHTNGDSEKAAYYLATSKWFQDRHARTTLAEIGQRE